MSPPPVFMCVLPFCFVLRGEFFVIRGDEYGPVVWITRAVVFCCGVFWCLYYFIWLLVVLVLGCVASSV